MQPLLPLIAKPNSKKQRKEAERRFHVAREHYAELTRLGQSIQLLEQTRAHLVDLQLGMALSLRQAGAPMEGVLWKQEDHK